MKPSNNLEDYKEIAVRWIKEGWQKGNSAVVDELHSADFVDHSASGRENDCKGFKEGIEQIYIAFPDFYAEIDDNIIDLKTGKAAIRWTAQGTHSGEFYSTAPTQKKIHFSGIEIIRIEKGKITERWGEWNGDEIIEQIKNCDEV